LFLRGVDMKKENKIALFKLMSEISGEEILMINGSHLLEKPIFLVILPSRHHSNIITRHDVYKMRKVFDKGLSAKAYTFLKESL